MKKFASIAVVVVLLLAAAIYYGNLNKKNTTPTPDPDPDPVVKVKKPTPKEDKPDTSATMDGTLKLTAATSHGYIAKDSIADIYATIDVQAVKYDGKKRPPLNVAIVIDRSGSMAGDKIVHAKAAAKRLVDLLDEGDRVSIVSYGSDVSVDFSSRPVSVSNRGMMLSAIDGIDVSGGTNLSGGYEKGLSEVQRWKTPESINRVILMSDGNANIGVTYLPELERMARNGLNNSVSLSSIGVGLDYNEDLMTRMANEGAGNYYFVDNATAIAQVFETELKGLASTIARNTALVIKLAPGVSVDALYGFPYQQTNDSLMISLAEFRSEQAKNILFKLKAPGDLDGKRAIMDVSLSYTDMINDDKLQHQTVSLASVVTADTTKAQTAVDSRVIARVQQIEVANAMQDAMKKYEEGDTAGAADVIDRQQRRMRSARKKYDLKDDSWDRVDNELSSMKTSVKSTSNRSDSGRKMIKKKKARSNYILFEADAF